MTVLLSPAGQPRIEVLESGFDVVNHKLDTVRQLAWWDLFVERQRVWALRWVQPHGGGPISLISRCARCSSGLVSVKQVTGCIQCGFCYPASIVPGSQISLARPDQLRYVRDAFEVVMDLAGVQPLPLTLALSSYVDLVASRLTAWKG